MLSTQNRVCGPRPNKHNNAFTKEELVKQIVHFDLMSREEAERASMKTLCEELNIEYTDPSQQEMSKYSECLKTYKKRDILENYKEYFEAKGFTDQQVKLMKKEKLCDIIYGEDSDFVIPEDFKEENCSLYDMGTLTRIAVRKHIDTTRYKTQPELCRAIHITYLREKMNFNTEKNPEWDNMLHDPKNREMLGCMIPRKGDTRLQEHQMRVVRHMLTHRSLLAIHATGTGKTLTAVSTINCMLAKYPNIRIIIITPLTLVDNMKNEMRRFGLNLKKDPELYTRVELYSYDEYVNLQRRKKIVECKNTFLIIDEVHNLRTDTNIKDSKLEKGTKSYVIMKCAAEAFKVLLLTATPIINNIFDLRNLMLMLDGKDPENPPSKKEFLSEVKTSLGNMINCKVSYYDPPRDENYPERIDKTIDMYMDPEYYNKYKAVEMQYYNPSIDGDITKLGKKGEDFFYHNLRIALNSLDGENSPKVNWIYDFITKEAAEGRKSVVYSNWKKAGMNLVRKRLDALNTPGTYIYISGNVPSKVRKLARKKFNNDEAKILLITRAGGEGLDLKGVRNVIIMESNWNASADAQIIGRGIRYKSHLHLPEEERNVTIYRMLLHKPEGNEDILKSIDDILYKKSYEVKLPVIKEYLNTIKDNSIESNGCSCNLRDNDNAIGCQSITVPDVKERVGGSGKKEENYEAPSGLTSIAISVDEVSRSLFRKLAGVGVRKPSKKQEEEPIEEEDFEMGEELPEEDFEMGEELPDDDIGNDEYVDEYQNRLDSPNENEPANPKNVKIDEEEDEPEVVIEDEDF